MHEGLKIVCLGDSITYGFPYGPQDSWVSMLSQVIEGDIINKGINGNTTWDMLHRFDRHVLSFNPTHVIIMGGINDVLCGESLDRICFNLNEMVEKALANEIKVVLGLPTAVDDHYWEKTIQRLRDWLVNLAEQKCLAVIPFHQAFYKPDGSINKDFLLPDGGHPTREGYQAMFTQINLDIFTTYPG